MKRCVLLVKDNLPPNINNIIPLCVSWDDAFTLDEIDKIVEMGYSQPLDKGMITNHNGKSDIPNLRSCTLNWHYPSESNEWIFSRVTEALSQVNSKVYHYELANIEPLQFASYNSNNKEFYGKHLDCTFGVDSPNTNRKLSVTLQLTDSDEYEGGDLLLYTCETPVVAPKKKGMMIVFPSFIMHEVTPVTKGHRHSLVTWAHGPLFK